MAKRAVKKKAPAFNPGRLTVNVSAPVGGQERYDEVHILLLHIIAVSEALGLDCTPPLFFVKSFFDK